MEEKVLARFYIEKLRPLCILSVNCILGLCVTVWNIPIHIKDFHTYYIQEVRYYKAGNARFTALIQVNYAALIRTLSAFWELKKKKKEEGIYILRQYFPLEKLNGRSFVKKNYISTEFNCGRISVIVDLAEYTFSRYQLPCEKDYKPLYQYCENVASTQRV